MPPAQSSIMDEHLRQKGIMSFIRLLDDKRARHRCVFAFCLSKHHKPVTFVADLKGQVKEDPYPGSGKDMNGITDGGHLDTAHHFWPDGINKPLKMLSE